MRRLYPFLAAAAIGFTSAFAATLGVAMWVEQKIRGAR